MFLKKPHGRFYYTLNPYPLQQVPTSSVNKKLQHFLVRVPTMLKFSSSVVHEADKGVIGGKEDNVDGSATRLTSPTSIATLARKKMPI